MAWKQETSSCVLGSSMSTGQQKPYTIYIIWSSRHELFPCSFTRCVTRLELSYQISAAVLLVVRCLPVACSLSTSPRSGMNSGNVMTTLALFTPGRQYPVTDQLQLCSHLAVCDCTLLQWLWVQQPQRQLGSSSTFSV